MTQAEKNKLIKELQEKLAEAEKIEAEQPKRWEPQCNDKYWYADSCGDVDWAIWDKDSIDEWRYLTSNCFKTREEAEEHKKQIEYTARYKNYIEEHSEPLDWDKGLAKEKYYAAFNFNYNEIVVEWAKNIKEQGAICASSEQIIKAAIKEIGEDNFKKYVLGVK